MSDISFERVVARSENGVVVAAGNDGEPWARDIRFTDVHVTIGRFGNISRPCHDWRPAIPPEMFTAPTDGFFLDGVEGALLQDSSAALLAPRRDFYRNCLFKTDRARAVEQRGFQCSEPARDPLSLQLHDPDAFERRV